MKEILDLSRSTVHQLNAIKEAQSYNSIGSRALNAGLLSGVSHITSPPVAGKDIVHKGGLLFCLILTKHN